MENCYFTGLNVSSGSINLKSATAYFLKYCFHASDKMAELEKLTSIDHVDLN